MSMLEVRGLDASHGGARVLWGIDFEIAPGEAFALLGRNGAGKTTLLRALMGLHPIDQGMLRIGGEDASALPSHGRAELGVAYVPQGRGIFPKLTVEENLRLAPGDASIAFQIFPKLQQLRTRLGGNLSGGEQQQLAVGRALMARPRLLILDEPTEGVQPSVVAEIEAALQRAVAGDSPPAVLLVEQYLDFPWSFADRFAVLDKGRIVASGSPKVSGREAIEELLHV